MKQWLLLLAIIGLAATSVTPVAAQKAVTILNVSYDPTRELYQDFNEAFSKLLAVQDGRQGHRPAISWRLWKAGPVSH